MGGYYMQTGSQDPFYNLAFEEFVLTDRTEGDYILLWQNRDTVVIGQNQNTLEEIDQAFVDRRHIQVVRRMTGGGAVYHDLGNLNYSFITDAGDGGQATARRFTEPVVRALRKLGLDAEATGRNDILAEGRKVSGTAQRIWRDRVLHHGTLLFDTDLDVIGSVLRTDPQKAASHGTRSVASRVGNIRPMLPKDMDMRAFWSYLREELCGGMTEDSLTEAEQAAVRRMRDEKYATWAWNYGTSPDFDVRMRRRFPGGTVEAGISVAQGAITDIRFYGDFLSRRPLGELERVLLRCPFRREALDKRLQSVPLADYFGSISKDEILGLLFAGG